jgi:hypothetical protein
MRVTRLSGSEGGGILCDSPYPYSDFCTKVEVSNQMPVRAGVKG